MIFTIKLLNDARSDISDTMNWYNAQKSNLGNHFFVQLSETIDYLADNPKLFPVKHKNIRQASVSQFPFSVYYLVDETNHQVVVLAILHASRNPQIWKSRIR